VFVNRVDGAEVRGFTAAGALVRFVLTRVASEEPALASGEEWRFGSVLVDAGALSGSQLREAAELLGHLNEAWFGYRSSPASSGICSRVETECCTPAAQETCCEPDEKASCCGGSHATSCGCAAGSVTTATGPEVRETVREKYAAAARAAVVGAVGGCCPPADESGVFGAVLYAETGEGGAPGAAVNASLGCGVPTAVADLHEGEVVLDLGSGAGADVLISARRVGPSGRAIGIDMTDEMLELARANAIEAGLGNVEFVQGYLEDLPLPDASVDVVISNCVINLSGDKPKVLAEAARVLRPGGRFAVSDVTADPGMDDATRADMAAWTGCIAGALTEPEFRDALAAAGLDDLEFRETHRVHEHAAAAIIRARKPSRASR
jgi:arsenite methyltransferase